MQKRSEPSVEGFHIFKTYCVDSLARSQIKSAPFAEFLCLGIAHSEVWNKIPIVFLFWEMVQNEIPSIFIFRGMVWNKITKVRVFSSTNWFGTKFRAFFIVCGMVQNGIPSVFSFANRRNQSKFPSVPCSAESFFSSESGCPNTNPARIVSTEPYSICCNL